MLNSHIENQVEFTLKVIKEKNSSGEFITKVKDFDPRLFIKKYGRFFTNAPFFDVTPDEFNEACRAMDTWIKETYRADKDTLGSYELYNIVPPILEDRKHLPVLLQPFWDILFKVNQNKWCNYQVLKTPIPGFESLTINLFAGMKATSPFSHKEDVNYSTLKIKGTMRDIDKFIAGVKL